MHPLFVDEVAELQAVRSELVSALARLDQIIDGVSQDPKSSDAEHVRGLPRTRAIEWVLSRREGQDMRPVEIWHELQLLGRTDPKMEIQVTTFDLWERGRIGKSGRGQYHALPAGST